MDGDRDRPRCGGKACLLGEGLLQHNGSRSVALIDLDDHVEPRSCNVEAVVPKYGLSLNKPAEVDCVLKNTHGDSSRFTTLLFDRQFSLRRIRVRSLHSTKSPCDEVHEAYYTFGPEAVSVGAIRSIAPVRLPRQGWVRSDCLDGPASSSRGSQTSSIGPGWYCEIKGRRVSSLGRAVQRTGQIYIRSPLSRGLAIWV